jgi:UTP--glucose-1-phosphate uridylyltransferase
VPRDEISSYGCADVTDADGKLVRLKGIVEKPDPADAPSTLAVMGRYILTPEVFDAIDRTPPGKGNEIQLTDALALLIDEQALYGWTFDWGRFDIGKKIDFLRATVELALERPDLGSDFRKILEELLDRPAS